jgi:hypothetical protein
MQWMLLRINHPKGPNSIKFWASFLLVRIKLWSVFIKNGETALFTVAFSCQLMFFVGLKVCELLAVSVRKSANL